MSDSADSKKSMQILAGIAGILNKYHSDGEKLLLDCNSIDADREKLLLNHLQQNDHFFATTLVDNCNPATNENRTVLPNKNTNNSVVGANLAKDSFLFSYLFISACMTING